jgi:hypothetical protein
MAAAETKKTMGGYMATVLTYTNPKMNGAKI